MSFEKANIADGHIEPRKITRSEKLQTMSYDEVISFLEDEKNKNRRYKTFLCKEEYCPEWKDGILTCSGACACSKTKCMQAWWKWLAEEIDDEQIDEQIRSYHLMSQSPEYLIFAQEKENYASSEKVSMINGHIDNRRITRLQKIHAMPAEELAKLLLDADRGELTVTVCEGKFCPEWDEEISTCSGNCVPAIVKWLEEEIEE